MRQSGYLVTLQWTLIIIIIITITITIIIIIIIIIIPVGPVSPEFSGLPKNGLVSTATFWVNISRIQYPGPISQKRVRF